MNCPMALAQAAAPRTHVRGTGALADTLEDTEDPIMEQSTCHLLELCSTWKLSNFHFFVFVRS